MLNNFLKIAFRRLLKFKKYSFINILGLAIGLASFLMILLWVQDELSYDQFHENADDISMIVRHDKGRKSAGTSKMLISALISDYPEIVNGTSYLPLPESFEAFLKVGDVGFTETLAITDAQFFNIFSFEFKEGISKTAFSDPNAIVLSQRVAEKYFGNKEALGQTLELTFMGQKRQLLITGILKEMPRNTHIHKEIFVPFAFAQSYGISWDSWDDQSPHNYIQTNGLIGRSDLEAKILACKTRHYEEAGVSYSTLPLKDIHLHGSELERLVTTGEIQYVYFLGMIAVIILLIACMNYMNLSNALALKRTREIGIQKIVGAQKSHLVLQHIGETFLLTLIAMAFAILLVELVLPFVNHVSGKPLVLNFSDTQLIFTLVATTVSTAILSSILPAIFISGFQPIQAIKGQLKIGRSGISFRNAFTVLQFALTTIIIVSTFIVFQQLRFVQNKNLGFDHENVICLPVNGDISAGYEAFRNQLLSSAEISSVCRGEPLKGGGLDATTSINWAGKVAERTLISVIHVDSEFAKTYQIEMQEGRFYDERFPSDVTQSFVINDAARQMMGMENPINEEITFQGQRGAIVGVTRDFHFDTLHSAIEPLMFKIPSPEKENERYREISVRIAPNSMKESLKQIESAWTAFYPDHPFDFYTYDEFLTTHYAGEQRMGSLFADFAGIAIFIACLGLYGLIAFSIEQKVKEIGVHKVLGATVSNIVWVLTRRYLWLVFFSNIIAWPVTYFIMNGWLQDFAYRMHLTPIPFVGSALIVLFLAFATVSYQAIQAANLNPVTNLRNE